MSHLLDRYEMGYDSDVWCLTCRHSVPVSSTRGRSKMETVGDLVRAVMEHETARHHEGSPV